MYLSFFGLNEAPFSLTPNTRYFLRAESHAQALELLLVALREQEGFIKVSGEVGTGKTLLCRLLLNQLPEEVKTAYLPNPQLTPTGLFQALADELGLSLPDAENTHRALSALQRHLIDTAADGYSVVLVIDEAQAMPEETLEALRLLTNLETESRKLIQVVLFGQPELDVLLDQDSLRQLKQRITFQCRLSTLDRAAVDAYLQHRLAQAGFNGGRLFRPGAVRLIAKSSRGTPRLINILAHKALIAAYGQGAREITRSHAKQAIRDTDSARQPNGLGGWA
ncbi:MSHA biogenesis protein MshM [Halospina denitrificans]|uniref:MSHA biogenesis protein MshM n=1 Tax=Halospina denitrificans TaxID=332522 RepID=A0A4R7JGQ1_9GAMM|nr:AAA family ATPase [Halospina denitrificans]TDT36981.1 MSHA biogenesis protein MshM [Halospina denitrificans]